MPVPDGPTEGIFAKIFFAWIILAVIFYVWSYVRDGKFIGEDSWDSEPIDSADDPKKD